MSTPVSLILTSIDDLTQAKAMAKALVEQRLAACIQVSAAGASIYRWQGKVEQESEHYLQIKTTPPHADEVVSWLQQHHPYDTPEIICLTGEAAGGYADWLLENCD